jgi:hypothetical protein
LLQQYLHQQELARRRAYLTFNPQGVGIISASLMSFGTPEQQRRWAVPILRAEMTASLGMCEPGAGSDLASLRTRAVRDGFVCPRQGIGRDRFVVESADIGARPVGAERGAKLLVVFLWNAEQVRDDQQGERPGVGREEFALAVVDEFVDVAIGQPPHEVLVLLEPFRRQKSAQ